jgi:aminoglycoside phosphotransferase (APT) family kinase protein
MNPLVDGTRPVRPGEELDAARLQPLLARELGAAGPLAIEQFPSGHSNLTYLVRAGEREWVLRRPPFGTQVKTAHDMGREHRILARLHAVYPLAPRPVLYCDDPSVLGAPFYLMERIRGVILRLDPPPGLDFPPARARHLGEAFVDNLVRLHALDYQAAGLGELGRPDGYVARQVSGWSKRYADARTDDIPEMEMLAGWLGAHLPKESGAALIHNDYKYDNLVLDPDEPTRIVGVLDWEMSTLGDPLMDLGTALGYWVEAGDPPELQSVRMCATTLPGSLTRRELAERYGRASGRDVSDLVFYYAFALFKIAGVAQQIYARFRAGLTHDERFAKFIDSVRCMSRTAARAVEKGRF